MLSRSPAVYLASMALAFCFAQGDTSPKTPCKEAARAHTDASLEACRDSIQFLETQATPTELAIELYWYAYTLWQSGEYAQAENTLYKVRSLYHGNATALQSLSTHDLLSRIYVNQGRFPEAIEASHQALKFARQTNKPGHLLPTLGSAGLLEWKLGNLTNASSLLREALDIDSEHSWVLNTLGNLSMNSGRYSEALGFFQRGLMKADALQRGNILISQSYLYMDMGDFKKAASCIESALLAFKPLDRQEATAQGLLAQAELLLIQERGEAALPAITKVLDIYDQRDQPDERLMAMIHLSEAQSLERQYKASLRTLTDVIAQAEAYNISRYRAFALMQKGRLLLKLKRYADAAATARQSLNLKEAVSNQEFAWQSEYILGKAEAGMNRPQHALEHFKSAMALIERSRSNIGDSSNRESYLSRRLSIYEDIVELLLTTKDWDEADEAFRMSEKGKARGFLDSLNTRPELPDQHREARNLLEARIAWLRERASQTPGNN